jgi:methylated-DNA-[protein]-cysteine S-methyltransferase
MDRIDDLLETYFDPALAPADLGRRLLGALDARPSPLASLASRLRIDATERGIARIRLGGGGQASSARARQLAERARRQLREYFAGERGFFTVPVDLGGIPPFQGAVLHEAARIGFGEVISYAELARRVGRPSAARAVGNALGANPVPLIVPCHRIVRGDGTWGHYLFGSKLKTELLRLERVTPALEGCATTRIVCRLGCQHVRQDRRITFASVDDARSVGYRPCKVCRPR